MALCLGADPPLTPKLRLCRSLRWLAGPAPARRADLSLSTAPQRYRGDYGRSHPDLRASWRWASQARSAVRVRWFAVRWLTDSTRCAPSSCRPGTPGARNCACPGPPTLGDAALLSATVLKIHEDRSYPGAVVASLSVPWGSSTDTLGGYHLVWPRDATLTAFAFAGRKPRADARHILSHLIATQRSDGHWPQNYYPMANHFGPEFSWMRPPFRSCSRQSCAN